MDIPDSERASSSTPRDNDAVKEEVSTSESAASSFALSPMDASSRELVTAEETLWKRLSDAKSGENTHDAKLALKSTYADLAQHHAMLGHCSGSVFEVCRRGRKLLPTTGPKTFEPPAVSGQTT